jgi:chromosome segregation ATPase
MREFKVAGTQWLEGFRASTKLSNKEISKLKSQLAEAKDAVEEADATSNAVNAKWRKAVDKQTELESQLAEQEEYLRHHDDCSKGRRKLSRDRQGYEIMRCDCGLDLTVNKEKADE